MGQRAPTPVLFTADEYLHWEAGQIERHEFIDGEIFCMSGAGRRHVVVCMNIAMALRQHLRSTPCRTLMVDMKVQVAQAKSYFYPDVFVTCSPANPLNEMVEREPKLIVEVLSPSTANYDRTDKFAAYRQLTSLEEYALVDIKIAVPMCTAGAARTCGRCTHSPPDRAWHLPVWIWLSLPMTCLPKFLISF